MFDKPAHALLNGLNCDCFVVGTWKQHHRDAGRNCADLPDRLQSMLVSQSKIQQHVSHRIRKIESVR